MKVLMVEPGKVPYAAEIGEGLEPLQAAVGGDIQAVYPYDDPVALICNEEGKYMGLPLNRALHDDEGNIYDREFLSLRAWRGRFYRPSSRPYGEIPAAV